MKKFLDREVKKSISKVIKNYYHKRTQKIGEGKDYESFRERISQLRGEVFADFESNLKTAKEHLTQNGFEVIETKDEEDFEKALRNLLPAGIKIAQSKTNTGKELGLEKILAEFQVAQTDLGDFVVDLLGERDQHFVLPAIHLGSKKIASKIKEVYGDEIKSDPIELTHYLCAKIREQILSAQVGITGANFFTQDGSVVLLENEGNISLVSRLPQKHIVICGIDKLVANASNAMELCKSAAIFGTGQSITQYISVISGPSKTADIENQLVLGAQGAQEVTIILVDNGRRKMMEEGFGDLLRCINCGACLNFCPVYHQLGDGYGGEKYIGSKGVIYSYFQKGLKKARDKGSFKCTLCGNCYQNCPMKINLPEMVRKIREKQAKEKLDTQANRKMIVNVKKYGNPFGESKDDGGSPDKLYCC